MKTVLTIAGHDLSHGAGITKDIEVFSSQGFHALSVPTSFVIQGPMGAASLNPVPLPLFTEMLQRVQSDFRVDGIKIGVAADAAHVERIIDFISGCGDAIVVLDPIISAKNGLKLITDEGFEVMVKALLPLASCITPNLDEARTLVPIARDDRKAMEQAARAISGMGPKGVILKGGHRKGDPVDLLFDGQLVTAFERKRVEKVVHGTGCIFSSFLLSFLVSGDPLKEAFLNTEEVMGRLLAKSCRPAQKGYFYAVPALLDSRSSRRKSEGAYKEDGDN
jgi:hydroxymethylpyrimidine/phosphomethylpyrimidine kinase